MKTELLVQMDGLSKSDDLVFLLAASNLPWLVTHIYSAGNTDIDTLLSVEDIKCAVRNLKKGKAAGVDNIVAEHIHFQLYLTLMKRCVPVAFLNIIINWYSKLTIMVRWNTTFSDTFKNTQWRKTRRCALTASF